MLPFNPVDLVKLGFLGFAALLMLLAFYALVRAMKLSQQGKPSGWVIPVIVFQSLSVLVIGLGILYELLIPKIQVSFTVVPEYLRAGRETKNSYLTLYAHGQKLNLEEENKNQLIDNEHILINLHEVDATLKDLQRQIGELNKEKERRDSMIDTERKTQPAKAQAQPGGV